MTCRFGTRFSSAAAFCNPENGDAQRIGERKSLQVFIIENALRRRHTAVFSDQAGIASRLGRKAFVVTIRFDPHRERIKRLSLRIDSDMRVVSQHLL